ncbi:MAG TPA: histidine kinase [Candidatus Dormibacteraeota bacterium]
MPKLPAIAHRLQIRWIDIALAIGLTVGAVIEGSGDSSLAFSPAVWLCTVPMLLRRRWPISVLLLTFLGFSLARNAANFSALIAGTVAVVSVGLYGRNQILNWLVVLGGAGLIALEFGHGSTSTLPIPAAALPFALLGAAYLAGREVATRQRQLNVERDRAAQREREQEAAVKAAAEAERRHIARELHDVVAHSVSVMVVQAGAARKVMDEKPDAARESLLAVEASGHEAMAELRRLLGVLAENGNNGSAPLAPQPGLAGLDTLVSRLNEAGLPVELRRLGIPVALPPGVDVAAYRIVQEALTNALKYAGGARTEVLVHYLDGALDLEVIDEGTIATPADGIGRGLVGMRERVALFGGTIEAGKRAGAGYAVKAHLPIEQAE